MNQDNAQRKEQETAFSDRTDDDLYRPPTDEDWNARTLCSDDSCIGVIGPDGRCKDCGKPFESVLPETKVTRADPDKKPDADPPSDETLDPAPPDETEIDVDWDQRVLCRDEACIGVIGPDGRCNECGLPFQDR